MTALAASGTEAAAEPWRDPSRPVTERVADLLGRMTLAEKLAQLGSVWVGAADDGGDGFAPNRSAVSPGRPRYPRAKPTPATYNSPPPPAEPAATPHPPQTPAYSQSADQSAEHQASIQTSDFVFKACSGAVMADFVANLPGAASQWDEGPQLDEIAPANKPSDTTGLITLSVGGNDMGFPFVIPACVDGFLNWTGDRGCLAEISKEQKLGTQLLQQGGTIV